MLSIVNKLITQLAGESFVWKGLSIFILGLSTLSAYFIKTFYDLEIEISELKAMVSHQEHIIKSSLEVIAQNQDTMMKNQGIIVEDSYWQYITVKNICYFTLAIGVIGGGFWLYNIGLFNNSVLESIKDTNNLIEYAHKGTNNLIESSQVGTTKAVGVVGEKVQTLGEQLISYLDDIKRMVSSKNMGDNPSINAEGSADLTPKSFKWGDYKDKK